jgi:hypothetical protein
VVRHPLVQKIINAYEDYEQKEAIADTRKNWCPETRTDIGLQSMSFDMWYFIAFTR